MGYTWISIFDCFYAENILVIKIAGAVGIRFSNGYDKCFLDFENENRD